MAKRDMAEGLTVRQHMATAVHRNKPVIVTKRWPSVSFPPLGLAMIIRRQPA